MKIAITSASGNLLTHDSFNSITLMTESGEITVLPGHEPLLSVIRPGVMYLDYTKNNEKITEEYITGGGVITITPEDVTIVVDAIDSLKELMTEEEIVAKVEEAERLMDAYR